MKILITGGCGYIGSAIYDHLESACHEVVSLDWRSRHSRDSVPAQGLDYRNLSKLSLEPFDTIIHIAGHSSVAQCEADPWGAVDNNLTGFIPFLKMLSELDKPPLLLWASSGSVLSDVTSIYDTTKRSLEALVPRLYPRSIGMRFASVCGVSPNQRDDLILNAMVKSAVTNGYLTVSNPYISKPILGIKDLCLAVDYLLADGIDRDVAVDPTAFNAWDLCSFICSPEQAAFAVRSATGCEIRRTPASRAYEFIMNEDDVDTMSETLESIIADLVEYYRGYTVAVAGKGYDVTPEIRIIRGVNDV